MAYGAAVGSTVARMVKTTATSAVIAVLTLVTLAGPASAHAELVDTSPAAGEQLAASPTDVTLHFGEAVETALGAITLYDGQGHLVKTGTVAHPDGDGSRLAASVPQLPQGAYVVAWRVLSSDSHPVHGAFPFQVGTGSGSTDSALLNRILTGGGGDTTVGAFLAVARFLSFVALALVAGGVVFAMWIAPDDSTRRSTRRPLFVAAIVGGVASVAAVGLQGPYVTGQTIGAFTDGSNWRDVVGTRSGAAWAARAGLFFLLVAVLPRWRVQRTRPWPLVGVVVAGGLVLSAAYAGHGTLGRWPLTGTVATLVHLGAMAVWIGGLAMLLVVLWAGRREHRDDGDTVGGAGPVALAARFSGVAFGAVLAVVASGLVSAWRQVGSIDGLTSTTYGRLLIAKTIGVALVLAGAVASRRLVRHRVHGRSVSALLRRTVGAEVVMALVVLGLTSMLVASKPAIAEVGQPVDTTILQGKRFASIQIDPARQGKNSVHVTIAREDGGIEKPDEITVRATLPARDLGPIVVPTTSLGPSHVTSEDLQLPFSGVWQLEVLARYGDTESVRWVVTFTVN